MVLKVRDPRNEMVWFRHKNDNKIIKFLTLFFIIFFFLYFVFQGLNTSPTETDSIKLHIPVAEKILDGTIYNPKTFTSDLFYYPWTIEYLLAGFILLKIPLNLYNVFASGFLFLIIWRLTHHLTKDNFSFLLAISICYLPVISRWLNTQKNDIWAIFFYISAIYILEKGLSNRMVYLLLGIALGIVAGAKFFGWLFVLPILVIYYKTFINKRKITSLLLTFSALIVIGGSWLIRAYITTGNPIHPFNSKILSGSSDVFFSYSLLKYILFFKNGLFIFAEVLFSEYLFWILTIFILPLILFKKQLLSEIKNWSLAIKRIILLGFINLLLFILFPTWTDNVISSMRYGYYAFIPLIIGCFWLLIKYKNDFWAYLLPLFTIAIALTNFDFRPKIALVALFVVFALMRSLDSSADSADPLRMTKKSLF